MSGLVLLLLFTGNYLFHLPDPTYLWAQYFLLGTLFPLLVLALLLFERFFHPGSQMLRPVKLGLAGVCVLLSLQFCYRHSSPYLVLLTIAQVLLVSATSRRFQVTGQLPALVLQTFIALVTWTVAVRFVWGQNFAPVLFGSLYTVIIFLLAWHLVMSTLYFNLDSRLHRIDTRNRLLRFLTYPNVLAVMLLALVSLRTDHFFEFGVFHHWSFYIGPAELVRQGGWLLWDVPSQYGFLSILSIALFPAKTVWEALFLLNASLNFLSALLLFFIFRSLGRGGANLLFALGLALAAQLVRPLGPGELYGPHMLPSTGAFRFIWSTLLMLIVFWGWKTQLLEKPTWKLLTLGAVTWVLGCLWSLESAAQCSVIWLPVCTFLCLRQAILYYRDNQSNPNRGKQLIWLAVSGPLGSIFLLLLSMGAIWGYYLLRLGQGPDWYGFVEYGLSYQAGYAAYPLEKEGIVWGLVVIFCIVSTSLALFAQDKNKATLIVPTLMICVGVWGSSSYFMMRSAPGNMFNLATLYCIALGMLFHLFRNYQMTDTKTGLLKLATVPIFTILLTMTYGDLPGITAVLMAPQKHSALIDDLLPRIEPTDPLYKLGRSAQLQVSDPITFIDENDFPLLMPTVVLTHPTGREQLISTTQAWLPARPYGDLMPIPESRRQVYMSRFIARAHLNGWLIENKTHKTDLTWFYDQVLHYYKPTKIVENSLWRLTWFELRSQPLELATKKALSQPTILFATINGKFFNSSGSSAQTPISISGREYILIQGWTVDSTAHAVAGGVYLSLDGGHYQQILYGMKRQEVVVTPPAYEPSGFSTVLIPGSLSPGIHTVKFRVLSSDLTSYYDLPQHYAFRIT